MASRKNNLTAKLGRLRARRAKAMRKLDAERRKRASRQVLAYLMREKA